MISARNIVKSFGGVRAIDDASFVVEAGSITGLIGPNGAGKTTMFNTIAGHHRADSGQIVFQGEDISGLPPHALFAKGILRTFQLAHEFPTLSVLENLMMVPAGQSGEKISNTWLNRKKIKHEEAALRQTAESVIDFLNLDHLAHTPAGNLSGGQKKLLELGRTMMVDAKIVFLDEVGAGVNRSLLREIGTAIKRLNDERGYTFCMIEHDMQFISRLCDPVIVMVEGRVLTTGRADEILQDPEVIESYLGATATEGVT